MQTYFPYFNVFMLSILIISFRFCLIRKYAERNFAVCYNLDKAEITVCRVSGAKRKTENEKQRNQKKRKRQKWGKKKSEKEKKKRKRKEN